MRLRIRHVVTLVAVCWFAVPCLAQVVPHEVTIPKALTGAFGNQDFYLDMTLPPGDICSWYRNDQLPPVLLVTSLSQRRSPSLWSQAATYQVDIWMEATSLTFNGLVQPPLSNLTTNQRKVCSQTYAYPAMPPSTDPNQPLYWLPVISPYLVTNRSSLLIAATITPINGGVQFADGLLMQQQATLHVRSGKSCGSSLNASYTQQTYSLQTGFVPAQSSVVMMLSTENAWLGAQRLPIDLTPLGMAGCELGLSPQLVIPVAADAMGIARLSVPFALPSNCLVVSAQALHTTATSSWATTNVTTGLLGQAGLANHLFMAGPLVGGPYTFCICPTWLLR